MGGNEEDVGILPKNLGHWLTQGMPNCKRWNHIPETMHCWPVLLLLAMLFGSKLVCSTVGRATEATAGYHFSSDLQRSRAFEREAHMSSCSGLRCFGVGKLKMDSRGRFSRPIQTWAQRRWAWSYFAWGTIFVGEKSLSPGILAKGPGSGHQECLGFRIIRQTWAPAALYCEPLAG